MGSGAVGVEFASIFRRFGSDVTIVELLPRLVPVEDEAVSAELEKSFRKQGITSAHRREGDAARRRGADGVDVEAQLADGTTQTLRADYLLVATGRGPVTTGLDAEGVGLQMEQGYIKVDDAVPHERAGHLRDRRRDHARRRPGIRSSRTCRRPKGIVAAERIAGQDVAADQLRPRARLHLLRSGDRQRRPDRARSEGARLRRARSARFRSACSAARRWRARPTGS